MGGSSDNSAAINEQKKAAAEARYKDDLRSWRLEKGVNEINNLFDATPLPELRDMPTYNINSTTYTPTTKSTGTAQYDITPNATPWVDNLASTYQQAYNDYYMPQLQDKYSKAQDNLTFDLARAGLLRSTAAVNSQSDLAEQNAENTAMVQSQGDQGVASLKQKINSAKQDAINQLYSTENPDVAANSALSSIRTIQSEQPSYSPLGDIFKTAVVGMSGYNSGTAAQQYYNTITGTNRNAATTIN